MQFIEWLSRCEKGLSGRCSRACLLLTKFQSIQSDLCIFYKILFLSFPTTPVSLFCLPLFPFLPFLFLIHSFFPPLQFSNTVCAIVFLSCFLLKNTFDHLKSDLFRMYGNNPSRDPRLVDKFRLPLKTADEGKCRFYFASLILLTSLFFSVEASSNRK